MLYGESPPCHGGVQNGQQHQEERGGVEENDLYDKPLHDDKIEDESDRDKSAKLLLNVLYGESPPCHGGVQDGQQHQEERGGVEENELYEDESVQDGQQHHKEQQQDHRHGKTGKEPLTKSQRKRLRKKKRIREKSDRDQEEDQVGDHESHRNEEGSAEEVDKRKQKKKKRKKESLGGI